jgi:hypothetical protein
MTLEGSNRLADIADRIRVATRASAAAALEAARYALDAGRSSLRPARNAGMANGCHSWSAPAC